MSDDPKNHPPRVCEVSFLIYDDRDGDVCVRVRRDGPDGTVYTDQPCHADIAELFAACQLRLAFKRFRERGGAPKP